MRQAALAPGIVLLGLLLAAAPVLAHPVLEASSPAHGAHLARLPGNVTLTLSEPLDPAATTLEVHGPTGRIDEGGLQFAQGNRQVQVALRPSPAATGGDGPVAGAFEARWATLSREGHHVQGTVSFAVGASQVSGGPAAGAPPAADASAGPSGSAAWLTPILATARATIQAGTALALGAVALWAWLPGIRRRTLSNSIALAAALHVAGTAALLVLTTHTAALPLRSLIATEAGQGLYARLLLGLAAIAVMLPAALSTRVRLLAPAAAVALLAAAATRTAAMSHAATHGLAATVVHLMHTVAAGTWVGGLLLLAWAAARGRIEPGASLQAMGTRFGTLALTCVVALVATGVMDTFNVAPAAFTDPAVSMGGWWLALAAKVLLLGAMLLVGGINRFAVLVTPVASLQGTVARLAGARLAARLLARASFGRLVATEAIVGLVVLGLAGLLASIAPP